MSAEPVGDTPTTGSTSWFAIDSRPLLGFALLVAVVATGGSLYLSLGLGWIPCTLCWYQRILMYPLVVILGVALFERRRRVSLTVLPLSVLGGGIAAYHSAIQLATSGAEQCTIGSCSSVYMRLFGIFSIPNLALIAFGLITVAMLLIVMRSAEGD